LPEAGAREPGNVKERDVLDEILKDLVSAVKGASAAIFLDGDGEAIAHAGEMGRDIKLLGAWKEIHLDSIKEITDRLGLGNVHAVLFSLDEGNELVAPVVEDYSLILFMSSYADIRQAMQELPKTIELLKKDIA
jgi:predicted regulator of Ras-like GTPase activity (Roadblock/LC7/MglB family)